MQGGYTSPNPDLTVSRLSLVIRALTLATWLAIALVPVAWPLSEPGRSPFRLGPISTDVRAGQTFLQPEAFDQISLPLRVGGPFGSSNEVSINVRSADPTMSWGVRSEIVAVESTSEAMEQVTFHLEQPVSRPDLLYFEIEISPTAQWPTYTLATRGDQERAGRLYLEDAPSFADQDLVFQILGRKPAFAKVVAWWPNHKMTILSALILLALVHVFVYTSLRALAATGNPTFGELRPAATSALLVAGAVGVVVLVAFAR